MPNNAIFAIRRLYLPVCGAALAFAAPSLASGQGQTIRLSPTEVEAALEQGAARHKADTDEVNYITPPARRIRGEMGMMIGTGGARGLYGATEIPLGDSATAGVSFATERYGRRGRED